MSEITAALFSVVFGLVLGWVLAHHTVGTECVKLGAFYVGDVTFVCEVKK